jgi:prepilin-type N-terminal cleavage/methylation domain-containing protein
MKTINAKGFTIFEIMVVVAVIGITSALAIPNLLTARDKAAEKACRANREQIENALGIAALTDNASIADLSAAKVENVVVPSYLKKMPVCSKGVYSTDASGYVCCSVHAPSG